MSLSLTMITMRDIFQAEAQEMSKRSKESQDLSAVIILDAEDLAALGVKEGEKVRVTSGPRSVTVTVHANPEKGSRGLALMPNSPWSNQLVPGETGEECIPEFKDVVVTVEPTADAVTTIQDILGRMHS